MGMTCTPKYGSFEEHATGTVQILPARVRAPARVSPGDGGAAATLFVIPLLELIEDCCPYYPIF